MTPHKITFREAPRKRAILEKEMVYDILLNGNYYGNLSYNMRGYIGYLPLPDGRKFDPGEISFTAFKREAAKINREAAQQKAA